MNTIVKFNDQREFLQEMQQDRDSLLIDRRIVRLTKASVLSSRIGDLRFISIVATYKTKTNLVKLEHFVGEALMGSTDAGTIKTWEKAEQMILDLTHMIESIGLKMRPGLYMMEGEKA